MQRMRTRILLALFSLCLGAQADELVHARLDEMHRAFFKDYCVECHNAKKQKGKLRLDDIAFTLDSVEKADLWQKILNSINSGEMPPEDEKQPSPAAKTDFLDDLSRTLVTARMALSDSGGKITMRRLNRREYKNTIRDLLGVDLRVNELPADGGAGSFDTVGSSHFMSSDQFEQYLALGRQALDEHFARYVVTTPTKPLKLHIETEATINASSKDSSSATMHAHAISSGQRLWKQQPPSPRTPKSANKSVRRKKATRNTSTTNGNGSRVLHHPRRLVSPTPFMPSKWGGGIGITSFRIIAPMWSTLW